MNSRERFRESLLFGNPDKVSIPCYPFVAKPSLVEKWYDQGLPRDDSYIRILGLEHSERLPLALGPLPRFEEKVVKELGDHRLIRNWLGQIVEVEKNPEMNDYYTKRWVDFPVKDRDDFEKMKWRYNPESPAIYPDFWEDVARSYRDRTYPVSITMVSMFWRVRDWTGLKGLSIMFHKDPDLVHDMMDFWTEYIIVATERALRDVDVDYVLMSDDMAYKGRAMIGPEMMREFMLPNYRKWTRHFKSHGVDIIMMDSDGYIHEIAPVWAEAGINVLCPMEVNAGNDMLELREEMGHEMAFLGGIDKTKIALGGEALRKEFQSKVPQLIEDGGYIPCCDHHIPPNITWPRYCHYVSLLKEFCGWES